MSSTERVVTLLPSATEIVAALGVDPVAVSHECDYPPRVADRPAATTSRIDADADSERIDEQVLDATADGAGVYSIRLAVLRDADPDVVVTQGICDVCAVDTVLVREAVDALDADPAILTTDPHSLGDVYDDIGRLGRALGGERAADALVTALRERVAAVESRVADAPRPDVAVLDWTNPVMHAGHWVPELVAAAGGRCGLAATGDRSEPMEWARIRAYDPDVLVVAPCGFGIEQTRENLSDLTEKPGWAELTAVQSGRVYAVDGHHYMNRPGPRLVDSLELLAACLHPERFDAPRADAAAPLSRLAEAAGAHTDYSHVVPPSADSGDGARR